MLANWDAVLAGCCETNNVSLYNSSVMKHKNNHNTFFSEALIVCKISQYATRVDSNRHNITGSPAGLSRVNGAKRCSAELAIMRYFQNGLTRSVLNRTS